MTIARPMFPPRRSPARAVPIYSLTPNQLEALHSLDMLRRQAEAEVERLIAFLDMVDGYSLSEREDALPTPIEFVDRFGDRFADDEREEDMAEPSNEDIARTARNGFSIGAIEDDEPSLCGLSAADMHRFSQGEIDGEEEADDEPSLCGLSVEEQFAGAAFGIVDGEEDAGDDREIENEHADSSAGLTVDDEPSFGGVGSHEFQPQPDARWRDLELEADGSELVLA